MGRHAARPSRRPRHGASPRAVTILALVGAALLGLGTVGGTWAFWTDKVTIGGTSVTGGTIDVRLDDADAVTSATLSMTAMVPGSSAAQVFAVKDAGTAPLKYSVSGGLSGTDAAAYATAGALKATLVAGGSRTTGSSGATCTGGTTVASGVALTTTTTSVLLSARGPLAASGTESLCVQVTLDAAAPTGLQGKTAQVALAVTGTSDLS